MQIFTRLHRPLVVPFLLGLNVTAFLVEMLIPNGLLYWFALWPVHSNDTVVLSGRMITDIPSFLPWQLLSYSFLHGSFMHLFFNMFALWMFGSAIEMHWRSGVFLAYYLICVVGAGIVQLLVVSLSLQGGELPVPTVGASGGVFGVLMAFAWMFPNQKIMLLIPPIPIKAKWFVLFYGLLELYLGFTASGQGIAHFAHLGGLFFGWLTIMYWRGRLPVKPKRRMPW